MADASKTHTTHIVNSNDPDNGLKISHSYDEYGQLTGSNIENAENFGRYEPAEIDFSSNDWMSKMQEPIDFGNVNVHHSITQLYAKPEHKKH